MNCVRVEIPNPKFWTHLFHETHTGLIEISASRGVVLTQRDNWVEVKGNQNQVSHFEDLLYFLSHSISLGLRISSRDLNRWLTLLEQGKKEILTSLLNKPIKYSFKKTTIIPRTPSQKEYCFKMRDFDITFGIGPAGTGKTYLAVAYALEILLQGKVSKIMLVRPAVEAGENLGFLPGDLTEKILPYLRPLYDALYEMIGKEETEILIEKGILEITPLAYMRGRTLRDAAIILDEGQNTTPAQMMMFLTRLGDNAKMLITGDLTQVDLPRGIPSGLRQALERLKPISKIAQHQFHDDDVLRNPLVSEIIKAYRENIDPPIKKVHG